LSRYLFLSFLIALSIHFFFALTDLSLFKVPLKVPPKRNYNTLAIDLIKPALNKKTAAIRERPLIVQEPKKKDKKKKEIKPRIKSSLKKTKKNPNVKKITHKRRIKKERPPKMDKKPIHFQKLDSVPVKEKKILPEDDNVFLPDMVDIPMAFPVAKEADKEINHPEQSPSHTPAAPIIEAVPMYKKNSPPLYPKLARKRGYQGKVVLEVLVKKDGHAGSIRLITSSGYKILDKTAIKGVKKWLFHPGKKGDELVEMWVKIPVSFILK